VEVDVEHERRGDVSLVLMSPSGTRSNILSLRPLDNSSDGIQFTFMTVHHWGEDPEGTWTLEVQDHPKDGASSSVGGRGRLRRWSLVMFGVAGERPNHRGAESGPSSSSGQQSADASESARPVGTSEIKDLMEKEEASSDSVRIQSKDEVAPERNGNRRRWLLEKGFEPEDVDFLIALFETELDTKNERIADRESSHSEKLEGSHSSGSGHRGAEWRTVDREASSGVRSSRGESSDNRHDWWRRTYDTSRRSYWNPEKRNLESVETDRERVVDQEAADDASWNALISELTAILEEEDD